MDQAPLLGQGLAGEGEDGYRPISAAKAALKARRHAFRSGRARQMIALSRAQKLWGSRPEVYALARLAHPAPSPVAVGLDTLLRDMRAFLSRYLHARPHAYDVLALWVLHTWVAEWFDVSPRLGITSATPGGGRSTALRLLAALVPRPLSPLPSAQGLLAAVVDQMHPTLLVDDADDWAFSSRSMRTLITAGADRSAVTLSGKEYPLAPVALSCFTPCAYSFAGEAPLALRKRSIVISLPRPLSHERREVFVERNCGPELSVLRAQAARWASDCGESVGRDVPLAPEGFSSAQFEIWQPLLSIAQREDAATLQQTHAAAAQVAAAQDERSAEIDLLADIRAAFDGADRLSTEALLKILLTNDAHRVGLRPAAGRCSARRLAERLRPFGIRPRALRVGPDAFARGYMAADFAGAFTRYLRHEAPCVHKVTAP